MTAARATRDNSSRHRGRRGRVCVSGTAARARRRPACRRHRRRLWRRKLRPRVAQGRSALAVTLVEANATYTALPHSNAVIAGLTELAQQQFGYDKIKSAGVNVALSAATAIDPAGANGDARRRHASSITSGWWSRPASNSVGAIQGYDRRRRRLMPPAYNDGEQVALIRRQLEAMDDGGTVVISSPVNPARCPPAPYERASLIAHYLKTKKPKSKVIVLDAKESFTMQKLFEAAWQELYPGMIEWVGLSNGGALSSVDAETQNALDRLRQIQGRGRQHHPAAEGRTRRRTRRRRRPHRLVSGRSRDVRFQAAEKHPRHRRRRDRRRDAALGVGRAFAGADCAAAIAALLAGKTPARRR